MFYNVLIQTFLSEPTLFTDVKSIVDCPLKVDPSELVRACREKHPKEVLSMLSPPGSDLEVVPLDLEPDQAYGHEKFLLALGDGVAEEEPPTGKLSRRMSAAPKLSMEQPFDQLLRNESWLPSADPNAKPAGISGKKALKRLASSRARVDIPSDIRPQPEGGIPLSPPTIARHGSLEMHSFEERERCKRLDVQPAEMLTIAYPKVEAKAGPLQSPRVDFGTRLTPEEIVLKRYHFRLMRLGKELIQIWGKYYRRVNEGWNPERNSLIPLPYPFIIPGGRFVEIYYWDSYWIILGLLASGLPQIAQQIIDNFLFCVERFGFIPNGMRKYYLDRSQPPLLSSMLRAFYNHTKDIDYIASALPILEKEYEFWMSDRRGHMVTLEMPVNGRPGGAKLDSLSSSTSAGSSSVKSGSGSTKSSVDQPPIPQFIGNVPTASPTPAVAAPDGSAPSHPGPTAQGTSSTSSSDRTSESAATSPSVTTKKVILNRYYSLEVTPRPESYRIDDTTAKLYQDLKGAADSLQEHFRAIRAAAESGWDFSSRWLRPAVEGLGESGIKQEKSVGEDKVLHKVCLVDIDTCWILPCDLNAYLFCLENDISFFASLLGKTDSAEKYREAREARREAMLYFLWDPFNEIWLDYDMKKKSLSSVISAASFVPLWAGVGPEPNADSKRRMQLASRLSCIVKRYGIVSTNITAGLQWDSPNIWAPNHHIAVDFLCGGRFWDHQNPNIDMSDPAHSLAANWASRYINTVLDRFELFNTCSEKYDANRLGKSGLDGEYVTQDGFGWTNGSVLDLLKKFKAHLTPEGLYSHSAGMLVPGRKKN